MDASPDRGRGEASRKHSTFAGAGRPRTVALDGTRAPSPTSPSASPRRSRAASRRRTRRGRVQAAAGSGVALSSDGYLLTSRPRRRRAPPGGPGQLRRRPSSCPSRSSAADPLSDLAVIRTETGRPGSRAAGRGRRARVGQLSSRSATERLRRLGHRRGRLGARPRAARGQRWRRRASSKRDPDRRGARPGNSGGALADGRGRVIGVNTAGPGSASASRCRSTPRPAGSSPR